MINKVHLGDWTTNQLEDNSVQLIIADPPYFEVKGEFDFVWNSFDDYLKDVEKWAIECKRLLADNGTLFWYGDDKKIAYAQIIFDKYFNLENSLIWYKYNLRGGMFGSTGNDNVRSFPICTERVLMYSQDSINLTTSIYHIRNYIREEIKKAKGKIVFKQVNQVFGTATNGGGVASACLSLDKTEPTMITKEMYIKLQKWCKPFLRKEYEELRKEYEELRKEYEELRRPFRNKLNLNEVLQYNTNTLNQYNHATVKPETLTRALIQTCSRKGDLVLVPFAGSGTECAMAAKEGREFIGFDIEPKYVDMANARCSEHLKQTSLF